MVRYQLPIPNRRNMDDVGVELSEPPPGLSLVRVIRGPGGLVMLISADAEMAKPGLQGNLILNVFADALVPGRNGRPGRQTSRLDRHLPGRAVRSGRTLPRTGNRFARLAVPQASNPTPPVEPAGSLRHACGYELTIARCVGLRWQVASVEELRSSTYLSQADRRQARAVSGNTGRRRARRV